MDPLNGNGNDIATILTKISADNFRFGFEQQFNQIQNTTIRRINKEIDRVIATDDTPRRLAALERDYQKLEKNKALINGFQFDMRSNELRLNTMKTDVAAAISAFSAVDGDTNLTAAEVASLTEKRDALIKDTSALLSTVHPDISTPFVIRDIKNMYDTLKAMDPVVGTVDAAGSGSPTNGNRQILDDLNTLSGLIDTASDVTVTTAENATSILLNISASMAVKRSDLTNISQVELARQEETIAEIKANYGNILRVISLSYESRMNTLEQMSKSLQGGQIEAGSILNIFI